MADQSARRHGVNPRLFKALIKQESGFRPHAKSHAGAVGIAQITHSTARSWRVNPWEPRQALNAAAKHLSGYIKTYKRQGHDPNVAEKMALCAYNAGPGAVKKYNGCPPYQETQAYYKRILSEAKD